MSDKISFTRNTALENWLNELNNLLVNAKISDHVKEKKQPQLPVIFIVGVPRSGTTLFLQWLANSKEFNYPSNLISRFYNAPFFGAKIQKMLTDPELAFNGEMAMPIITDGEFFSELGKTNGIFSPNEFWYFWRRFFKFNEIQYLSDQQLKKVDINLFLSELAALEAVMNLPLAMKALMLNWNIPFLASHFPKAIFVHIKRDAFFNMQSLFLARKKYFSDVNKWYSFKPPEYHDLIDKDPYTQIAGQVYYTKSAIEKGMCGVPTNNKISVNYEDFCLSPLKTWAKIENLLKINGYNLKKKIENKLVFKTTNVVRISKTAENNFVSAYSQMKNQNLTKDN